MNVGKGGKTVRAGIASVQGGAKSGIVESASVKTVKSADLKSVPARATGNVRNRTSPASTPAAPKKTLAPAKLKQPVPRADNLSKDERQSLVSMLNQSRRNVLEASFSTDLASGAVPVLRTLLKEPGMSASRVLQGLLSTDLQDTETDAAVLLWYAQRTEELHNEASTAKRSASPSASLGFRDTLDEQVDAYMASKDEWAFTPLALMKS